MLSDFQGSSAKASSLSTILISLDLKVISQFYLVFQDQNTLNMFYPSFNYCFIDLTQKYTHFVFPWLLTGGALIQLQCLYSAYQGPYLSWLTVLRLKTTKQDISQLRPTKDHLFHFLDLRPSSRPQDFLLTLYSGITSGRIQGTIVVPEVKYSLAVCKASDLTTIISSISPL